ncbi:MAG: LicD family protein [Paludibacter sp.]|nr:LicD family protein [Paludibacter sp.]
MEEIEFSCLYGKDVLQKLQDRLLEMYVEIAKIFDENNIGYFINYGTLLGALRHDGFIPWDDDLDICVMKEDYKRGLQLLRKNLSEQFYVIDDKTDNYVYRWAKVMDKYSKATDYCPFNNKVENWGISIDLFRCSMEKVGKFDRQERANRNQKINHQRKLNKGGQSIGRKIRSLLILLICCFKMVLYDIRAIVYKREVVCETEPTPTIFPPEWLYPMKCHKFENISVKIPNKSELILQQVFGDWQTIPDVSNRHVHFENVELFDK